jgi:teichuronic acid biosynthesis glycosyltransferase TuaG
MPAYNAEAFISQAINSVLGQSYLNWELIIVNDGSTDNTSVVVKNYCHQDSRIIYFEKENEKQAIARNFAITKAKGDFVAFLDADDVWLSNRLELCLLHFNTHVFDLIFFDSYYSYEKGKMTSNENMRLGVKDYIYSDSNGLKKFLSSNQIPILTVLAKRKKLLNVGGFDPHLVPAEDYDLWIRLIKTGSKFLSVSVPISIYRFQNNSSTANDRYAAKQVIQMIDKNISKSEFDQLKPFDDVRKWFIRALDLQKNTTSDYKIYRSLLRKFDLLGKKMKLLFALQPVLPKTVFLKIFRRLI